MKNRTIEEMWPDHAGHTIVYSEHGRTDYFVKTLELADDWAVGDTRILTWSVADYDNRPCDGDITDTEMWCRTCGVVLDDQEEVPSDLPTLRP